MFFSDRGAKGYFGKKTFSDKEEQGDLRRIRTVFFSSPKVYLQNIVKALCTYERKLWWKMR